MPDRSDPPRPRGEDPLGSGAAAVSGAGGPADASGALTGASGSLTPDDPAEEFVPAERSEHEDPAVEGAVTRISRREGDRRRAERDEPGADIGRSIGPNERDGGYGSQHGLNAADYRIEESANLAHAEAGAPADAPTPFRGSGEDENEDEREVELGGDVRVDPRKDHF